MPYPLKQTTIVCLIAAAGVLIQIISGHPYPTIPPVFFILLIPAALIYFAPRRWMTISAILSGIFLTAGLFLSGASQRLIDLQNPVDSAGLWVKSLAVFGALIAACMAAYKNFRRPKKTMHSYGISLSILYFLLYCYMWSSCRIKINRSDI